MRHEAVEAVAKPEFVVCCPSDVGSLDTRSHLQIVKQFLHPRWRSKGMATLDEQMKKVQEEFVDVKDKITRIEALPEGNPERQRLVELERAQNFLREKEILLLRAVAVAPAQGAAAAIGASTNNPFQPSAPSKWMITILLGTWQDFWKRRADDIGICVIFAALVLWPFILLGYKPAPDQPWAEYMSAYGGLLQLITCPVLLCKTVWGVSVTDLCRLLPATFVVNWQGIRVWFSSPSSPDSLPLNSGMQSSADIRH
ncbi:hypothetical protein QJQ45_017197 [Haematococcus lacustris]|nr:hypothetical protein QJQ45_017197 [Haematococcus lacustris]